MADNNQPLNEYLAERRLEAEKRREATRKAGEANRKAAASRSVARSIARRKALEKLWRDRLDAWNKAHPGVVPTLQQVGLDKPRAELLRELGVL